MRARRERHRRVVVAATVLWAATATAAGEERWLRLGDAAVWDVPCRVGSEIRAAASCGGRSPRRPAQHRLPLPPRPGGARIDLAAAIPPDTPGDAGVVHLVVQLEHATGEPPVTLWERTLDPRRKADRGWQSTVVALPAGERADDVLVLATDGASHASPAVAWARPIVRRPVADAAPVRGIVVVSLDGLRADRRDVDHVEPSTPVMDRIARGGFAFTRAWAVTPTASTSHRAIWTGLPPCALGAGGREDTVATALAAAGWATAVVADAPALLRARGFDRRWRAAPTAFDSSLAIADAWLEDVGLAPFLLVVQTRQLERPGALPPAARPQSDPDAPRAQRERADYDAAVAWIDRQLGGLLGMLGRRGLLGRIALVVTAAHGTALGEHGTWGLPHDVHAEALHVPLLLHQPALGGGRHIPFPVELRDLARTLLDLTGVSSDPALPGESLAPLLRGATPAARQVFADRRGPPRESAVRTARFSWILQGDRLALYDLAADPTEQTDVAAAHPVLAADGLARLRALRARCGEPRAVSTEPAPVLTGRDG